MGIRTIFVILTSVLSLCGVFGQSQPSKIKGVVLNEQDEGLVGAMVSVLDTVGHVVSYTMVGKGGVFEIASKDGSILIVNMLGYEESRRAIEADVSEYTIQLTATTRIEEVTVRASKKFIKVDEDTVRYKAAYYADSTDVTVEQMLAKLPGIEVGVNGDIKYRGKPISTILVEGANLFESDYKIASKNLRTDYVDEVEVIDKYDDNYVVQQSKISKEVALNLKLKEKYKNVLSGNAVLGAGSSLSGSPKFLFNAHLFNLRKSLKTFYIQDSGNTGTTQMGKNYRAIGGEKTYDFDEVVGMEHLYRSVSAPSYQPSPELMDDGIATYSSLRGIYEVGAWAEIRANASYGLKRDRQFSSSVHQNISVDPIFRWEQSSRIRYEMDDADISLKYIRRMPRTKSEVRVMAGYRASKAENQDSTILNKNLSLPLHISTKDKAHDIKVQYSKLLASNDILLASFSYNDTRNKGAYDAGNGHQYRYYDLDASYRHFVESIDIHRNRGNLSLIHIANKKHVKFIIKLYGNVDNALIDDVKTLKNSADVQRRASNTTTNKMQIGGSVHTIYLGWKKTRVDLKTSVFHQGLHGVSRDLGYKIRLGLERKLTQEHIWNTHVSKWSSLPSIRDLNSITIWNSANSTHIYGVEPRNTSGIQVMTSVNRLGILGSYSWRVALNHRHILSGVILSHDFGDNNFYASRSFLGAGGHSSSIHATTTFSIPSMKGSMTSAHTLSYQKSNLALRGVLNTSYIKTYKMNTSFASRLSRYWYLDTGLRLLRSLTSFDTDHITFLSQSLDAHAKLSCHIKKWKLSCYGMYRLFSSRHQLDPFHFMKMSISRSLLFRDRVSIVQLEICNLSNQKVRSSLSTREDFVHSQVVEAVPMYAVLSWSLSI